MGSELPRVQKLHLRSILALLRDRCTVGKDEIEKLLKHGEGWLQAPVISIVVPGTAFTARVSLPGLLGPWARNSERKNS